MELFDIGRALQTQIFGSREEMEEHPLFSEHPQLLNRLVSKLTYCVRDAPPRYMAVDMSGVSGASGEGFFTIAVYTDDHLFHLTYDPTVDHIITSIRDRKSIITLEVLSAPNLMRGDVPGTFDGSLRVAATYNNMKVALPGDNRASVKNRDQLDAFFPTLLKDVAQ